MARVLSTRKSRTNLVKVFTYSLIGLLALYTVYGIYMFIELCGHGTHFTFTVFNELAAILGGISIITAFILTVVGCAMLIEKWVKAGK